MKLTKKQKIEVMREMLRCAVFLLWSQWEDSESESRMKLRPRLRDDGTPEWQPESLLAREVISLARDGVGDLEWVTDENYGPICDWMEKVGRVY